MNKSTKIMISARNGSKNEPLIENLGAIWSEVFGLGLSISIADVWFSFPISKILHWQITRALISRKDRIPILIRLGRRENARDDWDCEDGIPTWDCSGGGLAVPSLLVRTSFCVGVSFMPLDLGLLLLTRVLFLSKF